MATNGLESPLNTTSRSTPGSASWRNLVFLLLLWAAIYAAAVRTPPLLDDADATHAQAAQAMLRTHDFVILHVDGVPYLEKAPLPYWLTALSLHLFGNGALAVHLPLALTILGLALLGWQWSRLAWGELVGLLAGLATLTSFGVFLFTRVFIPDALLSLLLALTLYLFLRAIDSGCRTPRLHAYAAWVMLALAVLTKGLVALVFVGGAALLYLAITRDFTRLYRLKLGSGLLLFLAIAAPWHVLAALRYPERPGQHGFLWFYFVNEHFLRYIGQRQPRDYNKLPALAYWLLHLVWLFPWSLFAPASLLLWWRERNAATDAREHELSRFQLARHKRAPANEPSFTRRTEALLTIYAALVLVFFAFSTNQEYYTLPAYVPILMLLTAPLSRSMAHRPRSLGVRALFAAHALFVIFGAAAAAILGYALWTSRHATATSDIGALMARRDVGGYTLSMSHFFDLTAGAFAALRLPALVAATSFALGPAVALWLHVRTKRTASLIAVTLTSSAILIAAHVAFVRFAPLLSSYDFAQSIRELQQAHQIEPKTQVMLFGDQAGGSSIPYYLDQHVLLVDGRSTSMLFGSTLPDAAPVFLTHDQLKSTWGTGNRKILFVPDGEQTHVEALRLSPRYLLMTESSKSLYTDRPLATPSTQASLTTLGRIAEAQPVLRSTP
ncbi:Dolichyl-phosphate-mannose-protein mannosyltransferase [Bryocella elongata]|uniref:Dolichyl-phosphate-mannose-protein mannosyltransferase n=1 Tax=Bryocella elongata TaxID=863522 RepID=A0A1H6BZ95_9BACT|nr:glycosyltransferase family 39 protein [Bryocella elongata]SEG66024.1 Dolichyl-phosphate-mannose-protein mannosyltransferase [Bryocella elongata]